MSPRADSPYPADWVRVARQDWHRIHVMLADGDGEGAALFLQQALEKYLKTFLLQHGWKVKKIHTLPGAKPLEVKTSSQTPQRTGGINETRDRLH